MSKDCQELGALLEAYADEEISAAERKRVSLHVHSCPSCRKKLRWIEASKASVRAAAAPSMPADLKRALLDEAARHRRAKEVPGFIGRLQGLWHTRPWEIGFAAAFAATALILAARLSVGETVVLPLDSVLAAHNDYVRTMPLSSQDQLLPDASERIDAGEGQNAL
jgi:anti-sigma factor RsiW